jgi:hypothetical protein
MEGWPKYSAMQGRDKPFRGATRIPARAPGKVSVMPSFQLVSTQVNRAVKAG